MDNVNVRLTDQRSEAYAQGQQHGQSVDAHWRICNLIRINQLFRLLYLWD